MELPEYKTILKAIYFKAIHYINNANKSNNKNVKIMYTAYPSGSQGCWSQSYPTSGERLGTPWAGH